MKERIKDPLRYCLIRLHRYASVTPGGLAIPDAHLRKNMIARVLQVGSVFHPEGYKGRPVLPEDQIIFRDWGSIKAVPEVGKNLFLVPWDQVVAIVDPEVEDPFKECSDEDQEHLRRALDVV